MGKNREASLQKQSLASPSTPTEVDLKKPNAKSSGSSTFGLKGKKPKTILISTKERMVRLMESLYRVGKTQTIHNTPNLMFEYKPEALVKKQRSCKEISSIICLDMELEYKVWGI